MAGYFGVPGKGGVLITSVRENSPAAKAGLKAGDVITEVDGKAINGLEDLLRAINSKEEGEINLTIVRDKEQRAIQVTPERSKWPGIEMAPDFQFAPQGEATDWEQ